MLIKKIRNRVAGVVRHHQYRSTVLGALLRAATGSSLPFNVDRIMDFAESEAMGPVQRSEALLLYAITKVMRPQVIVEFGFSHGHSAETFLAAADWDVAVHSFDISEFAETRARRLADATRFFFHRKSQDEFLWSDVGSLPIDLVFLDAAHDLELNQRTWSRLVGCLAPDALVAVHDTGVWPASLMSHEHREIAAQLHSTAWLSSTDFAHQLDERRFVNWIRETFPEFAQINFHTTRALRHGLTLLQRSVALRVTAPSD